MANREAGRQAAHVARCHRVLGQLEQVDPQAAASLRAKYTGATRTSFEDQGKRAIPWESALKAEEEALQILNRHANMEDCKPMTDYEPEYFCNGKWRVHKYPDGRMVARYALEAVGNPGSPLYLKNRTMHLFSPYRPVHMTPFNMPPMVISGEIWLEVSSNPVVREPALVPLDPPSPVVPEPQETPAKGIQETGSQHPVGPVAPAPTVDPAIQEPLEPETEWAKGMRVTAPHFKGVGEVVFCYGEHQKGWVLVKAEGKNIPVRHEYLTRYQVILAVQEVRLEPQEGHQTRIDSLFDSLFRDPNWRDKKIRPDIQEKFSQIKAEMDAQLLHTLKYGKGGKPRWTRPD